MLQYAAFHEGLHCVLFVDIKHSLGIEVHHNFEFPTCDPLKYTIDNPIFNVFICMGKSIRAQRFIV